MGGKRRFSLRPKRGNRVFRQSLTFDFFAPRAKFSRRDCNPLRHLWLRPKAALGLCVLVVNNPRVRERLLPYGTAFKPVPQTASWRARPILLGRLNTSPRLPHVCSAESSIPSPGAAPHMTFSYSRIVCST